MGGEEPQKEGAGRTSQGQSLPSLREEEGRKKAREAVLLWSPRNENHPRAKERNILQFLPEGQGLCERDCGSELKHGSGAWQSIRKGMASPRVPSGDVVPGLVYEWPAGSRLLQEEIRVIACRRTRETH